MPERQTCQRCGAGLTQSAGRDLCPACLIREGLAGTDEPDAEESPPQGAEGQPDLSLEGSMRMASSGAAVSFGDYELLEKLGQGGMGVVYKARHRSLDRLVAIKLLPFGPHAAPESVKRFRAEAVATAALQHPHIVAIHDVGVWQGQHFLAMDYVEGQCFSTLVRGTPLPARRAAGYVKVIAEAIHFAHEHGILHRDLKPANVLIDAHDQPRVTDFGLARRLQGDSELTLSGQVLGSPSYISPEQAGGKRGVLSRRSDVYALGAILYEALTGRPPFAGESIAETVQQVLTAEPLAPRAFQTGVPADLETVCLKCLEKEPAKRYATAQMLADDLGRFLEGQPVLARPISPAGKAWRWCRRNPRLALAVGVALVSLVSGLAGVTWQWRRAESQRGYAEAKELLARQNAYAADMSLAQRALEADQVALVLSLLEKYRPQAKSEIRGQKSEADLRGWEWRYLWRLCQPDVSALLPYDSGHPREAACSRDGRLLAVASAGGQVNVWNLDTQQPLAEFEAPGWLKTMVFSADDRLLAVSRVEEGKPPTVECWEFPANRLARAYNPRIPVRALAFSPDTRLLATLDDEGLCDILEWRSGRSITNVSAGPFRRGGTGVLAFSPDGKHLAIGADYGSLRVADLPAGPVREIDTGTVEGVSAVAFSPDSELLAACFAYTGQAVWLWQASSGQPQGQLTNAAPYVRALAFSPDGRRLAAASVNGSIGIWAVPQRTQEARLRGHPAEGLALAFGSGGQKLVSACGENTACGWDFGISNRSNPHVEFAIAFGLTPNVPAEHFAAGSLDSRVVQRLGLAFTPDSRSFISTEPDGALGLWDARTVQQTDSLATLGSNCWQVTLSPDGLWLAVGETAGRVDVYQWPARRLVATLEIPYEFGSYLRFSSSGHFLMGIAAMNDHRVVSRIWSSETWKEVPFPPLQAPGVILGRDLSPDDQLLAIGYTDGAVRLWDFPSGRLETAFTNHQSWVNALVFSRDGRRLVSASGDSQVFVWDVAARRKLASLRGHSSNVWSAALSPDGKRLVTGGDNPKEAVKLWDLATERELLTLPALGQHFVQVGFSPDGNTILATSLGGVAHLWRAPGWDQIERVPRSQRSSQ